MVLMAASLVGVVGSPVAAQGKAPRGENLVLRHATLLDGIDTIPKRDVAIVIRDGRIVSVRRDGAGPDSREPTLDLHGAWVVPGLIDAHAHVGLDGTGGQNSDLLAARRALDGGATTLRSAGADGYADVAVRERFRAGDITLPRMLPAGYALAPIVSEDWLSHFPMLRRRLAPATPADTLLQLGPGPGWRLSGNPAAIDTVVGVLKAQGASWVNVVATGRAGLESSNPLTTLLTEQDMRAVVTAARKRGLFVEADAHGDDGIRAAVRAGVRTVEHGTYASDSSLRLMRERSTCLVPTLNYWEELSTSSSAALGRRAGTMRLSAVDAVRRARKLGVQVMAGTGSRYGTPQRFGIVNELQALVHAGLSPSEALVAATSVAARCLGVSDSIGALVPGRSADLLVIAGDPREGVSVLAMPDLVLVAGRAALNRATMRAASTDLDLKGFWVTGSTDEPEIRLFKLTLQCNYTPPLWGIDQIGDTVQAASYPASRASGVPTPARPRPLYAVGQIRGVNVVMTSAVSRYVLRYDSTSGHLRGTLNGAPFWAARQEVIHPKGCIPPP
jgi:imidazolonepropionase-like amidohydrolase